MHVEQDMPESCCFRGNISPLRSRLQISKAWARGRGNTNRTNMFNVFAWWEEKGDKSAEYIKDNTCDCWPNTAIRTIQKPKMGNTLYIFQPSEQFESSHYADISDKWHQQGLVQVVWDHLEMDLVGDMYWRGYPRQAELSAALGSRVAWEEYRRA